MKLLLRLLGSALAMCGLTLVASPASADVPWTEESIAPPLCAYALYEGGCVNHEDTKFSCHDAPTLYQVKVLRLKENTPEGVVEYFDPWRLDGNENGWGCENLKAWPTTPPETAEATTAELPVTSPPQPWGLAAVGLGTVAAGAGFILRGRRRRDPSS